ncbi:MAG: divergent polysaccharide deacetylase family protein, partial [Candidatus Krumholzibacteriota bacterium]|nr:divergent polysaccharide deacetylase family protein [Candidatus Krumholzibacteriota bacterium]
SVIRARVPAARSLIQVNAAITKEVESMGARVRAGVEKSGGRSLEMEIGTRRTVTHRCYFRRGGGKRAEEKRSAVGPVMAILVDDFGSFNNRLVKDFLALEASLTISVIPGLKYSGKICRQARDAGKEILCHLPMEPEGGGKEVGDIPLVRVAMKDKTIEDIVNKALRSTPGVVGMNNHQGSLATTDRRVMEAVLRVCRKRKLFFVDSKTTPRSVVVETALSLGVPSVGNDLFLDNRGEDTRENMKKLLSIAVRRGRVTGIMHVKQDSLEHLRWLIREAREQGVTLITISEMIARGNDSS